MCLALPCLASACLVSSLVELTIHCEFKAKRSATGASGRVDRALDSSSTGQCLPYSYLLFSSIIMYI